MTLPIPLETLGHEPPMIFVANLSFGAYERVSNQI